MRFDIIILSYSPNSKLRRITEDCIKSLEKAQDEIQFDVLIIESNNKDVLFKSSVLNVKTIFYDKKFNYNHFMNYGVSLTNNKYILLCNNDLHFHKGFAENLLKAFKMGIMSLSPYCRIRHTGRFRMGNHIYKGWGVGIHIAGWCIAVNRDIFKKIGKLNEDVDFWYSDNIYAHQLRKHKVDHAIVCNAVVDHVNLGSQTLKSINMNERIFLTKRQRTKFEDAQKNLYEKT